MAEDEIKFVEEIPPKGRHNPWLERLRPLVQNAGRPAQVAIMESAQQAQDTVGNLNRRRVIIPRPDHQWVFVARENVIFAIYKGKGVKPRARVRRTKRGQ